MAARRTITIESPPENTLSVQVDADLVDRFVNNATKKGGSWRSKEESFQNALESAVAVSLIRFLEVSLGLDVKQHESTPRYRRV